MDNLCGVPLRKNLVPESKYAIKCPYPMVAKMVTYHNTDNEVSAWNEIAYMVRNNLKVSYHFAIDETEAVQGLPLDRNGWHCGDGGNGYGNRNTVGVEIPRNYDRTRRTTNLIDPLRFMYTQAELNTIKASPKIFELIGVPATVNTVRKHQDWSGKWCPSKILNEKRWDAFQVAVIHEYNQYMKRGEVSDKVHEVKAGDTLSAIARAYKVQLGDLVTLNGIKNPDIISLGQKITIPLKSEEAKPVVIPKKSVEVVANEIVNRQGGWGDGRERVDNLRKAGYDPSEVQNRVNVIMAERSKPKKPWREVALEIYNGDGGWGNNPERRVKLVAEGYDPTQVQGEVNRLVQANAPKPVVIIEGDRVEASVLYRDAFALNPVRRIAIRGFVQHIDKDKGWRNKYRLEGNRGSRDFIGFARLKDLKKL